MASSDSKASRLDALGTKSHYPGICTPLFCVRTHKSLGIGDFGDLKVLIDLAAKLKVSILQLLPMNDTDADSSPYSSISAFALNPIYIDLSALISPPKSARLKGYEKHLKKLNQKDRMHYKEVRSYKIKWLKLFFEKKGHLKKFKKPVAAFAKKHKWAGDFALFCALKEHHKCAWWHFPKSHQNLKPAIKRSLKKRFKESIAFTLFVQWLCFEQLQAARVHAEKKKVHLKGDVPFLLVKDSADVWLAPKCFCLSRSTGTPPSERHEMGQNWGFPPYNWKTEEKACLELWKRRLKWQENFYHLYRLDHAIGFFRIWSCYPNRHSKYGNFVPRTEKEQLDQGRRLLKAFLKMSPLLPIAEDLGLVTHQMQEIFKELGILGTRVTRYMHKKSEPYSFFAPKDYPRLTMTTAGTHDMPVLAEWWKKSGKIARRYAKEQGWKYDAQLKKNRLHSLLTKAYQTHSAMHISMLDEFLALFPKYIPICVDRRRVNVPGTWNETNWSYRFVPTLQELLHDRLFIKTVRSMTQKKSSLS